MELVDRVDAVEIGLSDLRDSVEELKSWTVRLAGVVKNLQGGTHEHVVTPQDGEN